MVGEQTNPFAGLASSVSGGGSGFATTRLSRMTGTRIRCVQSPDVPPEIRECFGSLTQGASAGLCSQGGVDVTRRSERPGR